MSSSWQVRLAAVLVGLDVLLGAGLLVLAQRLLQSDPGFLFAVLPVVVTVLFVAGLVLVVAALMLALQLLNAHSRARLHAVFLGGSLVLTGLPAMAVSPVVGVLMTAKGLALVGLMLSDGAKQDLGGWSAGIAQPAPWGSTPGTAIWSDEPVQQGPWSPPPTSVPWVGWKGHSGPRPPWWQTWEVALRQGVPLWEAILLGLALLAWAAGIVLVFLRMGQGGITALPAALIAGSLAVAWWLERRMRIRLSDPQASA